MGDLNSKTGNSDVQGIMHSFNEKMINDNGEILIQTCALNELRINNTYFDHKEQQKYTFVNTRGQKSIIDYVITNRNINPSRILNVRILKSANIGTQHGLGLCKYCTSHIIKKGKLLVTSQNLIQNHSRTKASENFTKTDQTRRSLKIQ